MALAAGRLAGLRDHPFWPLRWGLAAAAGAGLLHGAVDVPAHRAALGWWLLALAGLALQRRKAEGGGRKAEGGGRKAEGGRRRAEGGRRKAEGERQGHVQHAVFVLAGLGAIVLGGSLVRAEWFGGAPLPPFAAERAPRKMFDAYQRKDYAAGMALARRTLREAPLTASAYFYAGLFLAVSDEEGTDAQVDDMFQAERVLDPVTPDVPRHQAATWAGYDPARQTALSMDELGRMARTEPTVGRGLTEDLSYYRGLVGFAAAEPDVQRYLLAAARPDRRFEQAWTRAAGAALVQSRVDRIAEDEASVSAGKCVVRPDWYLQPESAWPVLPATPGGEWENAAWPVRLRQCVFAGQYERAMGDGGGAVRDYVGPGVGGGRRGGGSRSVPAAGRAGRARREMEAGVARAGTVRAAHAADGVAVTAADAVLGWGEGNRCAHAVGVTFSARRIFSEEQGRSSLP